MKITKITLDGFRAFNASFELHLPKGKNLLLYGENGSGKSSICLALRRFFEERGDDISKYRNHFAVASKQPSVVIHLHGQDASGVKYDEDIFWDTTDIHPLKVPATSSAARVSGSLRQILVDGARRAGFLDYRAMSRTHLIAGPLSRSRWGPKHHEIVYGDDNNGLEQQLFDLVSMSILAGVRVPSGGGETTLGALMRKVWQSRPETRHKWNLASAAAATTAFNAAFNGKLQELESKLAEFLKEFENHQLAVTFKPVTLAWEKASLSLKGAELVPIINFRGQPIPNYHRFLNEARLSALSACIFLAGVFLSDNDYSNSAYPRFLVLDDALIGLEVENRLPILNLLSGASFQHYQKFLMTHDRTWFDLARQKLPEKNGWVHIELLADESTGELVPIQKPAQNELVTAARHLAEGEFKSAAVHARSAFEAKLRQVCQDHRLKIAFKTDPSKIQANDLWTAILEEQRKRDLDKRNDPTIVDFLPAAIVSDVEIVRSKVLNQLIHYGQVTFTRQEVQFAIKTIESFQNLTFPKAKP